MESEGVTPDRTDQLIEVEASPMVRSGVLQGPGRPLPGGGPAREDGVGPRPGLGTLDGGGGFGQKDFQDFQNRLPKN